MLHGDIIAEARRKAGLSNKVDVDVIWDDLRDAEDVDGPRTQSMVKLAVKPGQIFLFMPAN